MFTTKRAPATEPQSADSQVVDARRSPVSGTMARVVPQAPETLAEFPSSDEDDDEHEGESEEATRISSPLRILHTGADEESTSQYHDLPTRVMHPPEESIDAPVSSRSSVSQTSLPRPLPSAPPASSRGTLLVARAALPSPQPSAALRGAHASRARTPLPPTSVVQPAASVVVAESESLELERALLRALTATAPRMVMPPVVAIRSAPPSPRMLAIVAAFTTLGLLWVMAVCAMVLVLVTR